MGLITKAVLYGGIFGLGFMSCYTSCTNRNYSVVEQHGRLYVQDKNSGKMSRVENEFCIERASRPENLVEKDLADRIKKAYRELTR